MARYFPSNQRFAASTDFFNNDPNYDRLSHYVARENAATNAQYLTSADTVIGGVQDAQYNVIQAQTAQKAGAPGGGGEHIDKLLW